MPEKARTGHIGIDFSLKGTLPAGENIHQQRVFRPQAPKLR
jgi:hypothetical protein